MNPPLPPLSSSPSLSLPLSPSLPPCDARVVCEQLDMFIGTEDDYSYFSKEAARGWAGPAHWSFRKVFILMNI